MCWSGYARPFVEPAHSTIGCALGGNVWWMYRIDTWHSYIRAFLIPDDNMPDDKMKDKGVAYLLWCGCLLGACGLHRFLRVAIHLVAVVEEKLLGGGRWRGFLGPVLAQPERQPALQAGGVISFGEPGGHGAG